MRTRVVSLLYSVASGVAIFLAALGLVGLVLSEDDRLFGVLMIGVAVLVWMVAYAARYVFAPQLKRPTRRQR
jgi:hypothetical protein